MRDTKMKQQKSLNIEPEPDSGSSEGRQSRVDAHQSAQQFTAEGCAAAVLHGESHLVYELLQSVHTFQGLTGHLTEQDTHTHTKNFSLFYLLATALV